MKASDKEEIISKLRAAAERCQQRLLKEKDDASADAAAIRGKIDGLMEAINLVRGS